MDNEYMKEYMKQRRVERRAALMSIKGNACEKCGSTEKLEFNHIDRTTKSFVLSGYHLDKSWDRILVELEKCELLCTACHIAYTAVQYSSGEIVAWNKDLHGEHKHGTPRMYHEKACRCEPCRAAKRMYRNKLITNDQCIFDLNPQ